MSLLGCHLPSMPWDVGKMGTTSWKESTGHNFILWWAMRLIPLAKMHTFPWHKHISPAHTTLLVIVGLDSKWIWQRIFCFADLAHFCLPRNQNNHVLLGGTMTTHASKPSWHCLYITWITSVLWKSFSSYSIKCHIATVQKHSHTLCSIFLFINLSDNRKHINTPSLPVTLFDSVYSVKLMCFFDAFIFIKTHIHYSLFCVSEGKVVF